MSCIESDRNSTDDVGNLQASALHTLMDLAELVSQDCVSQIAVDPEMHRQMKTAIRSIERNCGFANT